MLTSGWKVFALHQRETVHSQSSRISHVSVGIGHFPWPDPCLEQPTETPWRPALWKHPFNLRGICSGLWINFVRNSVFKGRFQLSSSLHSIANVYLRAAWRVNSLFFSDYRCTPQGTGLLGQLISLWNFSCLNVHNTLTSAKNWFPHKIPCLP